MSLALLADAPSLLKDLGANAGLVSLLVLAYGFILQSHPSLAHSAQESHLAAARPLGSARALQLSWWGQLTLGLLFGVIGVVVMHAPVQTGPGVIVDTRELVIGLAAMYLPLPSAVLAAGLTALGRLDIGGLGAVYGVANVLTTLLIGLLGQHGRPAGFAEDASFARRSAWLFFLGVLQTAAFGLVISLMPEPVRSHTLTQVGPIYAVVLPTGMVLFGLLMEAVRQLRRQEFELVQVNAGLQEAAEVFTHSFDPIFILDADARFVDVNQAFCAMVGFTREELVGHGVNLVLGDRHPDGFYKMMRAAAIRDGQWEGEVWRRRKDGSDLLTRLSITPIFSKEGVFLREVCVSRDLTQELQHREELEQAVNFDPLTGLPNRRNFTAQLHQAMKQCSGTDTMLAVGFLDLDNFYHINQTHGRRIGDRALIELAKRLRSHLGKSDVLGRLGGDEFVLFLAGVKTPQEALSRFDVLREAVKQELTIEEKPLSLEISTGVTFYPLDHGDADALLRHADQAMYHAKDQGKGGLVVFDPVTDSRSKARRETVSVIDAAIDAGQMALFFQPKIRASDGTVCGAECLIRWHHPTRGLLAPGVFIHEVTGTPTSQKLDRWVMKTAVTQLKTWSGSGQRMPLSINLAVPTLVDASFLTELGDLLTAAGLPPGSLEVELLETETMNDLSMVRYTVQELDRMGVRVSIDDFGTGYSSLSYLQQLPAHLIKIDQSFVRDMLSCEKDQTLVHAIISLAKTFGRQVVAEGVETVGHARALREMGCDILQGYAIARPMPRHDLEPWLELHSRFQFRDPVEPA